MRWVLRESHAPTVLLNLLGPSFPVCSTISDLAYCREVEAVVTASRDSTVKVWEVDWQIRMVFVGHTGAVHSFHSQCSVARNLGWSRPGFPSQLHPG